MAVLMDQIKHNVGVLILARCVCGRGSCSCHRGCAQYVSIYVCVTTEGSPWLQLKRILQQGGDLPSKPSASSPHTLQTSTQASLALSSRDGQLFQGRALWLFPCVIPSWSFLWEGSVLHWMHQWCEPVRVYEGALTPIRARWQEEDKRNVTMCAHSLTLGPSYCSHSSTVMCFFYRNRIWVWLHSVCLRVCMIDDSIDAFSFGSLAVLR